MSRCTRILLLATFVLSFAPAPLWSRAQQPNTDALRYRYIGPVGNRTTSIAGVPSQPYTYYAGVRIRRHLQNSRWRYSTGKRSSRPAVSSIGSLAVAPSDANTVWAGTGEAWIRTPHLVGQGIYKSTDAGKTWKLMGLEKTGRIGHLAIDPKNPDNVLACALGHAYGPQQERGPCSHD